MLALLEKKCDVKIISFSKEPASNGCDFAFSWCRKLDRHLFLNNASGITCSSAGRGLAHSPARLRPAQVLFSGFQGITNREGALSWLPAQQKMSLFTRRAGLQLDLCVITCK